MKPFLAEILVVMHNILLPLGIIVFGALVHATAQLKIARDRDEKFTLIDFVILFVIAAFSGTIVGLSATLFFESDTIITLSAGIGAFLGMAGVNTVANAFLSMLVSKIETKKSEK
jgi:uncharacterized membrane protein